MSLTIASPATSIRTLGALRESGYKIMSIKDEIRANLIKALREGHDPFPGVLGFDQTVIPQIQNAILGRHDFILLGLRGQAKSRILRLLPGLLDEFIPIVAGSDLRDNPFDPISKYARDLIEEHGDETPIEWLHRSERYGEKLATPDTSIADLIGDIDPIKAAHRKLTYADEEVIHFGIIPRTNRGIFAINELPDLQPRIQVGLLNIMEEQDIQIRGFNIRFPLDLLMVFSANPEDYTNRGSIITPLKDRIDSQIITHYPATVETGIAITDQEAWQERTGEVTVHVPHFFREIIEQVAFEARGSEYVDQNSGVSARMTRAALENLISAAERRALLCGERETTARPSDLWFVEAAITGKLELVYEGEQEGAQTVAQVLTGRALKNTFARHFPSPERDRAPYQKVLQWFAGGGTLELHHDMPFVEYAKALDRVDGLREVTDRLAKPESPAVRASTMELVLEALHQQSLLGKEAGKASRIFVDMMGSMLSGIAPDDDEDFDEFDQ
ncbi:MAG: magnesium chelatase [Rhodothermales bacterium]|nr:magnesium chelatase [Rhodothermales bacterium]